MVDALDLYHTLQTYHLLENSPKYWWPNVGSFEVVIGAILTQNTTWHNVEKSLHNLAGYTTLETFSQLSEAQLKTMIRPSGFYNQKAPRLLQLTRNIIHDFGTFSDFQKGVTRKWLLAQKGIGEESADAILCYGCLRAEMVVDSYTKRLLGEYGVVFKTYGEYKEYLESPLREAFKQEQLFEVFSHFHGMIVEYYKQGITLVHEAY